MVFHTASASCRGPEPEGQGETIRAMMGPLAVQQAMGQAISMCWMMLPKEKKNPDAVAAEIRRIVERALANLREDAEAFRISDET